MVMLEFAGAWRFGADTLQAVEDEAMAVGQCEGPMGRGEHVSWVVP